MNAISFECWQQWFCWPDNVVIERLEWELKGSFDGGCKVRGWLESPSRLWCWWCRGIIELGIVEFTGALIWMKWVRDSRGLCIVCIRSGRSRLAQVTSPRLYEMCGGGTLIVFRPFCGLCGLVRRRGWNNKFLQWASVYGIYHKYNKLCMFSSRVSCHVRSGFVNILCNHPAAFLLHPYKTVITKGGDRCWSVDYRIENIFPVWFGYFIFFKLGYIYSTFGAGLWSVPLCLLRSHNGSVEAEWKVVQWLALEGTKSIKKHFFARRFFWKS